MKVVAYSVKNFEKKSLATTNAKKHEITLISNALSLATCGFAEGKEAVLVSASDDVSATVINKLSDIGIKFIATRSTGTDQIDKKAAERRGIKIACVQGKIGYLGMDVYEYEKEAFLTVEALEEIAKETIQSLDLWQDQLAAASN